MTLWIGLPCPLTNETQLAHVSGWDLGSSAAEEVGGFDDSLLFQLLEPLVDS